MSYLRYSGVLVMRIVPTINAYRVRIHVGNEKTQLETVTLTVHVRNTRKHDDPSKIDDAAVEALTLAFHEGYPVDCYAAYDSNGVMVARSEAANFENMSKAANR